MEGEVRVVERHLLGLEDRVSPYEDGHIALPGYVCRDIAKGEEATAASKDEIHMSREPRHLVTHHLHRFLLVPKFQPEEFGDAQGDHETVGPRIQEPLNLRSPLAPPLEGAGQHGVCDGLFSLRVRA